MICYIEYTIEIDGLDHTKYLYYDNDVYSEQEIQECIKRGIKPEDTLNLSILEHGFLQRAIDTIQKISFTEGVNSQTLINGAFSNQIQKEINK